MQYIWVEFRSPQKVDYYNFQIRGHLIHIISLGKGGENSMQIASAQQGPCDGTSAVGQNNQKSGDFAETIDHRQGQRGHPAG